MAETVFARTPRLVWRAGTPDDVEALDAIVSDFDVVRQTETWPWPADLSFTRSRCVVTPSDQGASGVVCQGDEVVGYLGLSPEGKIGYMFGKSHWGRGLATDSAGSPVRGRPADSFAPGSLVARAGRSGCGLRRGGRCR